MACHSCLFVGVSDRFSDVDLGSNCALTGACTPSVECSQCNAGYYYNNVTHACAACDASCQTCSGPSSSQCLACNTGFVLTSGACSSCATGYHAVTVSGALTCPSCSAVSTGCIVCTSGSSSQCTECDTGYGLNGGACTLCSTGQLTDGFTPCHSCGHCGSACNASVECSSCNTGFFYGSSHACSSCLSWRCFIRLIPCDFRRCELLHMQRSKRITVHGLHSWPRLLFWQWHLYQVFANDVLLDD